MLCVVKNAIFTIPLDLIAQNDRNCLFYFEKATHIIAPFFYRKHQRNFLGAFIQKPSTLRILVCCRLIEFKKVF